MCRTSSSASIVLIAPAHARGQVLDCPLHRPWPNNWAVASPSKVHLAKAAPSASGFLSRESALANARAILFFYELFALAVRYYSLRNSQPHLSSFTEPIHTGAVCCV